MLCYVSKIKNFTSRFTKISFWIFRTAFFCTQNAISLKQKTGSVQHTQILTYVVEFDKFSFIGFRKFLPIQWQRLSEISFVLLKSYKL